MVSELLELVREMKREMGASREVAELKYAQRLRDRDREAARVSAETRTYGTPPARVIPDVEFDPKI